MKRIRITEDQIGNLVNGVDVELTLSPKRTLVLGTKTDQQIALEALEAKYEAKRQALLAKQQ